MRSMLALQPVWEVTTAHGEEPRRRETTTDSTFAPSTSFTQDRRPSISLEFPLSSASSPSPRSSDVLHPGQEALHLLGVPLVVGLLAVAQVQRRPSPRTGGPPSPWSSPCRRPPRRRPGPATSFTQ